MLVKDRVLSFSDVRLIFYLNDAVRSNSIFARVSFYLGRCEAVEPQKRLFLEVAIRCLWGICCHKLLELVRRSIRIIDSLWGG